MPDEKTISAPSLSVVLIAYNEAEVIERVVTGFLDEIVRRIPGSELIVAEDGSTDGTSERLRRLAEHHSDLRLLQSAERKGYRRALIEAVLTAKNEFVLFCDASGKHDPADIWKMLPLIEDHDLVVGFKEHRADPWYRIVLTRIFNGIIRRFFGVPLHDINCPFRLMRRSAFVDIAHDGWILSGLDNFEATIRFIGKGYRVAEVPVHHARRAEGPSRGLPLKRIPSVVLDTLWKLPRLKREAFFAHRAHRS